MSRIQLLTEHITPIQSQLKEQKTGGQLYLSGICAVSEEKNANERIYQRSELAREVEASQALIAQGDFIMGELNHPDNLSIDLSNVSHCIVDLFMREHRAIGKFKILNTPAGNIARGLIEGGVRLGVSTRGSGSVNTQGIVEGFSLLTIDLVAKNSAPGAQPDPIYESKQSSRIMTLAESVVHDPKAQASLQKEINAFLCSLGMRK